jgi:hypothetical protein
MSGCSLTGNCLFLHRVIELVDSVNKSLNITVGGVNKLVFSHKLCVVMCSQFDYGFSSYIATDISIVHLRLPSAYHVHQRNHLIFCFLLVVHPASYPVGTGGKAAGA